jgi:hypothetical protein
MPVLSLSDELLNYQVLRQHRTIDETKKE